MDPRQILQMMLKNNPLMNNSMMQNALGMLQRGDTNGIQTLVEIIAELTA